MNLLANLALACALSMTPHLFACSGLPLQFLKPLPQPRDTSTCRVVYRDGPFGTVSNQIVCKKVILGTFPDNQAVIDVLHGKKRETIPTLKVRH